MAEKLSYYVRALEHATSDRERLAVAAEIARVFS